ncbi:MAG: hypothetical protein K5839_01060 [Treponemataceae bacterium]|nr:hypothetical protein [Treponemataceae bacterium]
MKKFIFICLISLLSFSAFALPGIKEYIPTENGQYVYYKDNTSDEETYIGFLYYDEEKISIRKFCLDIDGDILTSTQVFFSMDPKADHIELTGEKLPDDVSQEDVEDINYIHNMLYELSAIRKHSNDIAKEKKNLTKTQDFQLFGGQVQISYDFSIPVFNIESISDISGKVLFQAVTMGSLTSSQDKSFDEFAGFSDLTQNYKEKKLSKKDLKEFNWQTLATSEQGQIKALGNDAIMTCLNSKYGDSFKNKSYSARDYAMRSFRLSSGKAYAYLPDSKIKAKGNKIIFNYKVYTPDEKNKFTRFIKIIELNDDSYDLTIISVFEKFYQENRQYFNTLY